MRSKILAVATVLSFFSGIGAYAQSPQLDTKVDISSLQGSIYNLERVTPSLWRGSSPSEEGLKLLQAAGIKTIIDLRMHAKGSEEDAATSLGMKYVRIPLGYFGPSRDAIYKFLSVVSDQSNGPVFVHCRRGEDRTGTLIGVYRRVVQRWPFEKVYAEMRGHNFKPWFFAMKETVEEACKNYDSAKSVTAIKLPTENLKKEPLLAR